MQDKPKRDLDFTHEEWSIILSLASSRSSAGSRIGWYVSVLSPIAIFCLYGSWKREITAVEMAFVCLFGCVIWSIIGEVRGAQVYRSIFSKIVASKESQETQSPS